MKNSPSRWQIAVVAAITALGLSCSAAMAQDEQQQFEIKLNDKAVPLDLADTILFVADGGDETGDDYWLGIECVPARGSLRAQLDIPEDQGLVVEHVAPEGPAERAGVKQHDILLMAGDEPMSDPKKLAKKVRDAKDKDISLKLLRKGRAENVSVKPAKRPKREFDAKFEKRLKLEGNPPELEQLMDKMRELQRGENMTVRKLGPGVIIKDRLKFNKDLPDDVSVNISRKGKEPAKITVKKGDQTFETTEDDIDKLPEDIRPLVGPMLGPMVPPGALRVMAPFPGGPGEPGKGPGPKRVGDDKGPPSPRSPRDDGPGARAGGRGGEPQDRMEHRLDQISRQLEMLTREMEQLKHDGPSRDPEGRRPQRPMREDGPGPDRGPRGRRPGDEGPPPEDRRP